VAVITWLLRLGVTRACDAAQEFGPVAHGADAADALGGLVDDVFGSMIGEWVGVC
jgi:hypothetical protein